jgi:hypothetical protein
MAVIQIPDPPPLEHGEKCLCVLCRVNPHEYWSVT